MTLEERIYEAQQIAKRLPKHYQPMAQRLLDKLERGYAEQYANAGAAIKWFEERVPKGR